MKPPFQVRIFGSAFMVLCAECGEVQQVSRLADGRHVGRDHQYWDHPTDDEQAERAVMDFEYSELRGFCARCGLEGHEGKACPTVTPDLLK